MQLGTKGLRKLTSFGKKETSSSSLGILGRHGSDTTEPFGTWTLISGSSGI